MSPTITSRFVLCSVERHPHAELLKFRAMHKTGSYDADGKDPDNNYAKFDPSSECSVLITNPEMLGQFDPGQRFSVEIKPIT